MPKYLREEDISAGFRAPIYSVTTCIPECNVCIYRIKPGECKKNGTPSDDFCFGERHDCPYAILNTAHFLYPKYQELYPEECKASAKKAEKMV